MKTAIYCQPLGGLCNRMRVITGAAELAKVLDRELIIIWTSDSTLNAKFSDLFESIPYKVIETPLTSFSQRLRWNILTRILGYTVFEDHWIKNTARGKDVDTWINEFSNKKIYLRTNLDIILEGDYSIFRPRPSLLKDLNTLTIDHNVIGMHIRRTDNANAVKYSPTVLFFEKAREELANNPKTSFYLATDDPTEEQAFIKEFGNKVIIYKKHSLDRNNPVAIMDAVVDLYNLSCCRKIYGSYYSSFSDTAALWSGIEKIELKNI